MSPGPSALPDRGKLILLMRTAQSGSQAWRCGRIPSIGDFPFMLVWLAGGMLRSAFIRSRLERGWGVLDGERLCPSVWAHPWHVPAVQGTIT